MALISIFHPAFEAVGGAELLCAQQAGALLSLGDKVRVVTFSWDKETWEEKFPDVEVVLAKKRGFFDFLRGNSRRRKTVRRAQRAQRAIGQVDAVVAMNPPASTMLGAMSFRSRRVWQCNEPMRSVHLEHANPRLFHRAKAPPESGTDFATGLWRAQLKRFHEDASYATRTRHAVEVDVEYTRKLDAIYAISEFSRDNARRIYGKCDQVVVYPIVQFPLSTYQRGAIDGTAVEVLAHTRLELLKNVDTVIRGFALMNRVHPKTRLHVVGDGPMRAQLEDLARSLMPANAVVFHGFLPRVELERIYARCDIFTLLTLDEPFGMVFPEAAARGLMLIGPDHGGPLEILDGGRFGQCVDPFDPEALGAALFRCTRFNRVELDRLRSDANRACRERFDVSVVAPKLRKAILGI